LQEKKRSEKKNNIANSYLLRSISQKHSKYALIENIIITLIFYIDLLDQVLVFPFPAANELQQQQQKPSRTQQTQNDLSIIDLNNIAKEVLKLIIALIKASSLTFSLLSSLLVHFN
jgi:hypothetical protein